jgi:hypothetical protein
MNDKDLLSAVREDFSGVRMHAGAEAILADGGSLRRRRNRRRAYGAGVTAVAAAAAVGVAALVPTGASSTTHAQLTAWTVQKEANGAIDVTIYDLLNLKGLEQKLKADGTPSEIVSEAHYPASCIDYPAMGARMSSVITLGPAVPNGNAFVIHPAGIPSGTKLLLDVTPLQHSAHGTVGGVGDKLWGFGASVIGFGVAADTGLVYDNASC